MFGISTVLFQSAVPVMQQGLLAKELPCRALEGWRRGGGQRAQVHWQ
jgi:hypothetical protein